MIMLSVGRLSLISAKGRHENSGAELSNDNNKGDKWPIMRRSTNFLHLLAEEDVVFLLSLNSRMQLKISQTCMA